MEIDGTNRTLISQLPQFIVSLFCADLNVLDWGEQGHLAIALSDAVYVMDTNKGGVKHLCSMESDSQYISSVLWSKTGKYLAVGTSNAEVQVRKCFSIVLHVYKCYSCPQQQQQKKGFKAASVNDPMFSTTLLQN